MTIVNSGRDDGIVHACKNCGAKNRVPYVRLDQEAKCGKCKTAFEVGTNPIDVVSSKAFDALLSSSAVPVVVDFWASWCGPCIAGMPQIEKAAGDSAGRYIIAKVNVDAVPDVSGRFSIRAVPTMIRFVNGKEAGRQTGAHPANAITTFALG